MSPDSAEIRSLAAEAFTYLYPLVIMDVTRLQLTAGTAIGHSPPNTFAHMAAFPPAQFREVVRPNFDTLYSIAWLDLSDGPVVIHVPDTAGRYYLLPMLGMWTDVFAVPGQRTTGTGAQSFVIVPPEWRDEIAPDAVRIDAPTRFVWVIGRTQTNGPADYDAVHAVQAGFWIRALAGGQPPTDRDTSAAPAGLDLSVEPLRLVNSLDAEQFFGYANRLLQAHPAHITDFSVLARIARIGVRAADGFDPAPLGTGAVDALNDGLRDALADLTARIPSVGAIVNGWEIIRTRSVSTATSMPNEPWSRWRASARIRPRTPSTRLPWPMTTATRSWARRTTCSTSTMTSFRPSMRSGPSPCTTRKGSRPPTSLTGSRSGTGTR
jgi:hypothetical protein